MYKLGYYNSGPILYPQSLALYYMHCKDTESKIGNKYFQKWNCFDLIPNSYIHVYVSDLFCIFPRSPRLFGCSKIGEPIAEIYINCSQIHECGNWKRGRTVSCLGIHKSDLVCSVKLKNTSLVFTVWYPLNRVWSYDIKKTGLWSCIFSPESGRT
jgi:hypothetical protein